MSRAYSASTLVFSVLLLALGAAMVVLALREGGGPTALGTILGVLFMLLGAARLWLALRGGGEG